MEVETVSVLGEVQLRTLPEPLSTGKHRLVHLDLKGAPPKLNYYEEFFPLLKNIGTTGILVEWEDTFPYRNELIQLGGLSDTAKSLGAPYSIDDARQILALAADNQLTVIPLVQTFGHLEFVLKHDEWRHLREVENFPSSMCPSNSETMALVRSMIDQIVEFHSDIEFIHIGADEVWHMGMCDLCIKRMSKMQQGKEGLYLSHLAEVAQYIKETYPKLKIIVWDDMLRHIEAQLINGYKLGKLVEPMVWNYSNKDHFKIGTAVWEKYNVFDFVWGASAFKGASGSCQIVPNIMNHVSNHDAWLVELGLHVGKIRHFRGLALTGWSRYDHYATLCELLPTATPSLCLSLKTWLGGKYRPQFHDEVALLLGYNETNVCFGSPLETQPELELSFPGWNICVDFERLEVIRRRYKILINGDPMQTWFNEWQVAYNVTNPMQYAGIHNETLELLEKLKKIDGRLEKHLQIIYYKHTVEELMETLIKPILKHLEKIKEDCETQLELGCTVRGRKLTLK